MNDILARLQRLEDIEAIRRLKARYLHACDRKRIDVIRDCFAAGAVVIDYGAIGCFDNREDFLRVYQEKACHPEVIDIHHGHNEQIEWLSAYAASATFDLFFYQIDTRSGMLIQLGGYYEDQFCKQDEQWKISSTRFVVTSTVVNNVSGGNVQPLFQGVAPPPI